MKSLQSARRDGFMNTLSVDTAHTQHLESTPHYIAPTAPINRTTEPEMAEEVERARSLFKQLGTLY